MVISRQHVPTVRFALVSLFVLALLLQFWVIPSAAARAAFDYPEYAYLERPYVIATGVALALFELALLAAWQVLSASITDRRPLRRKRWELILTIALVSSGVMLAGTCIHAGSIARVGGPPMLFGMLAALTVVVGAVALRRTASELTVADAED